MTHQTLLRAAASGLVAIALLLTGSAAFAATINGIVKNQANIGLPNVTVEWRNDATAVVTTVTTNATGQYSISVPHPATYTVKLTEPISGVVSTVPGVNVTGNTTRDFVLILADRLPPITFSGRALREDTGGPAKNLRIDVYNRDTGIWIKYQIQTDNNGYYTWTYQPEIGQTYGRWYITTYTGTMTDIGAFPVGWVQVRDYLPITGNLNLDFMVRTITGRGTITRCDAQGNPTNVPVEGVTIRAYMSYNWTHYGYADVSAIDGTFSTTFLQSSLLPSGPGPNNVAIQARALGYCAPYEDEPFTTPPSMTSNLDAYGSRDIHDFTYTKCLPPVPLMRTRVVDVEGNPIGNVEVQVYNETTNRWVVQSGNRYTERDRANTATYGTSCFGVSQGNLRVIFNSRSFDSGTYGGQHFGGRWGKTPAGRWQVNGFTMPATGLDLGDQAIPTLYLRGQTVPALPNVWLYAYLRWSSSYGFQQVQTDASGRYELGIIPSDKIELPFNPSTYYLHWYLVKTPPYNANCGGTPCVEDYEVLPMSATTGYPQGGVSSKTTINWEPGVPLTGTAVDWEGAAIPYMQFRFDRYDPLALLNWYVYRYNQVSNNIQYDYDRDAFNGSHTFYVPAREYQNVYVWMPSYSNFNPRSNAPHVPANRYRIWLSNYLVPSTGATLPWDTRELAHPIHVRVLTSLGLGVPGTVVDFDEVYQSGKTFNNTGEVDMYPYGGNASGPVDPALQFHHWNSWVTVTPPTSTGLPSFRINETTTSARTLTYIYPVANTRVPNILSRDIVARTTDSLTVQFVADQLVDGEFCCGLAANNLNQCTETIALSESHTLELSGLAAGTTYQCQVCGANASGAEGCSTVFSGTTLESCDNVPPSQSAFAYNISDTKINVTWSTNEACLGSVVVDGNPLSAVFEERLGTSHGVVLTNLDPETEYVLSVSCTDTCNNTRTQTSAVTTLETQTDPDTTAPICSGTISDLGQTYAIFQVTCNEPATVNVQCSDSQTFQIYIGQNNTAAMTLPVSVTSLSAGRTYQCGANGRDPFGNQAPFDLPNVTTPAAVLPMIITSGPTASASDTLATVNWVTGDSSGRDRAGTTELRWAVKTGATCSDPATWPAGNITKNLSLVVNHTVNMTGLQPETTYCYKVRSEGISEAVESVVFEFSTLALPIILAIEDTEIETRPDACEDAVVNVALSKPAQVILQVSAQLRPDGGLLNPITAYGRPDGESHAITVSGLTPGVTHYYTLLAYDQDGGEVRFPASGVAVFDNCGGPPNAAPIVVGTGPTYNAQCTSYDGASIALTGTVRDPYECVLTGCPGDEALDCEWVDTIGGGIVASAVSTGATAGPPAETQTCAATTTFPLGTSFVRLEAHEQSTNGLMGMSSVFQVIVRDTNPPCINAGPDVSWGAAPSDCELADGTPGVLVDVRDLNGDGSQVIDARPLGDQSRCGGEAVIDSCDSDPAIEIIPPPHDVDALGPFVHCVGYGQTVSIKYEATDSVGNKGSDTFTITVADLCDGVVCDDLDDQCVVGVCNPASGECETAPKPNLTPCDDDNLCTVSDVCRSGVCGGAPKCDYLNSALTCRIGVCDAAGECSAVRNPDTSCNHAPLARCVGTTVVLDASGNATVAASTIASTSIDPDSDPLTMSLVPSTFGCDDVGGNTVTATVSDFALSATCTATVEVVDQSAPTVACADDVTVNTTAGSCEATVTYGAPTAADNCGPVTTALQSGLGSGQSFAAGVHTETWQAFDDSDNATTCSLTVTVLDAEAPTLSCPSDLAADSAPGQCGATVDFTAPVGNDNCAIDETTQTAGVASGGFFAVGATSQSFTTTDASGLSATCGFVVTVSDVEAPELVCPTDLVVDNDAGACGATVVFDDAAASDNCELAGLSLSAGSASGSFFGPGTTAQTFTAVDAAGLSTTCDFTVTVLDTQAPVITCLGDMSVGTDPGTCAAVLTYTEPTVIDNCGDGTASLITGLGSGGSFGVGAHTEQWLAVDPGDNQASCTFDIVVADTEAPTVTCPSDTALEASPGQCGAAVTFTPPSIGDNCGVVTSTQTAGLANGATFAVGATTQTFTATDAAGLSGECGFTVTVTDTQSPSLTCATDITVDSEPGVCGAVVSFDAPEAADNCGVASSGQTSGLTSGALFPVGVTSQGFATTDTAGLETSCGFAVTVLDAEPPTITCPSDIVVDNDAGACGAVVTYDEPEALDNCGATATLAEGELSGGFFPVGSTEVVWTATDAAGQSVSCTFSVTVIDAEAPVVQCPAARALAAPNDGGCYPEAPDLTAEAIVTDNCGVAGTAQDQVIGEEMVGGVTTFTLTTTDTAGLTSSCQTDLTALERIQLVFANPLKADNIADDIDTDVDVSNLFSKNQKISVRGSLLSCTGADVTASYESLITARLEVTLHKQVGNTIEVIDLPETYSGVGDEGGVMPFRSGMFQYMLNTNSPLFETGTSRDANRWYRVVIWISWNTDLDVVAGSEDTILESK